MKKFIFLIFINGIYLSFQAMDGSFKGNEDWFSVISQKEIIGEIASFAIQSSKTPTEAIKVIQSWSMTSKKWRLFFSGDFTQLWIDKIYHRFKKEFKNRSPFLQEPTVYLLNDTQIIKITLALAIANQSAFTWIRSQESLPDYLSMILNLLNRGNIRSNPTYTDAVKVLNGISTFYNKNNELNLLLKTLDAKKLFICSLVNQQKKINILKWYTNHMGKSEMQSLLPTFLDSIIKYLSHSKKVPNSEHLQFFFDQLDNANKSHLFYDNPQKIDTFLNVLAINAQNGERKKAQEVIRLLFDKNKKKFSQNQNQIIKKIID